MIVLTNPMLGAQAVPKILLIKDQPCPGRQEPNLCLYAPGGPTCMIDPNGLPGIPDWLKKGTERCYP